MELKDFTEKEQEQIEKGLSTADNPSCRDTC